MDLDYQQKYLKYKKKYLDLKEYSGGGDDGGWFDFIFNRKKYASDAVINKKKVHYKE